MSWLSTAARLAWWSYWLGVAYWLGAARGERGSWWELAAVLGWPLVRLYGLVWGVPRRRRWFCRLAGHKAPTVRPLAFVKSAPRCRRCGGIVWEWAP